MKGELPLRLLLRLGTVVLLAGALMVPLAGNLIPSLSANPCASTTSFLAEKGRHS
jgi:hypothetical protein